MNVYGKGILVLILALSLMQAGHSESYRAAILHEPSMPVDGQATPVEAVERAFAQAHVETARLDADQLANAQVFNADAFDLLVIPTGASFPVAAKGALLAFLQRGGDLLCTGGYAFDRLWAKQDNRWIPYHDQWEQERAKAQDPQYALLPNGGFEHGADGWEGSSATDCAVVQQDGCSGRACGRVSNATPGGGVVWQSALPVKPGQSYLIGARMKGDNLSGPGFGFMAVYQYDAQGGLVHFVDFVQLRQNADWKRYETQADIAPNAAKVMFRAGLHLDTGTVWIDDATCVPLPNEEIINAHYGRPEDGLRINPTQLPLFSPDQPIEGDALAVGADSPLDGDWRSPGPVRGYEATAQLQGQARWVPLIEIRDRCERCAGAAGALVHHSTGPFADST